MLYTKEMHFSLENQSGAIWRMTDLDGLDRIVIMAAEKGLNLILRDEPLTLFSLQDILFH